ncbi:MAG: type 4a pilus biogenesis protein PilO [Gammaproteobacteria bacterium]|nr:type 4a pilus biogenesis protein PilO [Gammaproteobacteria bacterium]MCB1860413.1 type 4a pilus biogenesis protein PilO [Gammaproteobacteria bacterium]MCB1903897.1 type 4a pilus biogenesis protein PilO [Gammaproteobacteria bacterium]
MNLQELNELDLNNIGDWPTLIKALLVLVLCGAIGAGWYYFDTEDQLITLKNVEREEQELRVTFEKKQAKAVNLEKYQKQLEEMKQSFGAMLRQLPDKTEVAELLVDVSQTGLAAGLEFELFDPLGENRKDFYAELPIKIKVKGEYHQFGNFISGLATLPRIVTIHDIDINSAGKANNRLEMEAVAKTYRYLDEEGEK